MIQYLHIVAIHDKGMMKKMKYNDSGKAYHVKRKQSAKKKRKKELRKEIRERRKKGQSTISLEILLALED